MSSSYGLVIELSRNEKPQRYRIILSQDSYLHRWLVHFLYVYCCYVYFLSRNFLNEYKPRTTYPLWQPGPPGLAFYGKGLTCLPSWLGMVNVGWLCSMRSEFSCKWNLSFFNTVPPNYLFTWQPAPYNQLLIQPP